MMTRQALELHGSELSEETIGKEDRIVSYSDGCWGYQLRGTPHVYVFPSREAAESDYNGERNETATYTITNDFEGSLVARDSESGEIVAKVPSNTVVKHAKDSYGVIAEFGPALVGDVQSVDHDGEFIHVNVRIPAAIGINPEDVND